MSPSRHSSADSHRQGRGRIGRSAERAPVARRAQDREQNADDRSQPSAIAILRSACYSRLNAWQIWPSATRATIRRMVHGARLAATTAPASETYYPRAQRQRRATDPISAKTEVGSDPSAVGTRSSGGMERLKVQGLEGRVFYCPFVQYVAQGRGLVVVRPVSYGIEIRATSARLGSVCRARALCARLLHRRGLIGTLGNFRLSSARPYRASATPGRAASLYPILLEYHERH